MKKYQSDILKVIHQDAKGMHRLGIISDAEMEDFDKGCLVKEPKTARKATNSTKAGQLSHVTT